MATNKPEVKRYDCTSEDSYHCHGCFTMKEQLRGDYVEWEDYEALQAECDTLAEALEWLRGAINCTPENDKQKCGAWISTQHPRIKQIDALIAAYRNQGGETLRRDAERWEDVFDYVGVYQISSHGRVRSLDRIDSDGNARKGKILNPGATPKGYLKVSLWTDGSREERYVHRMVAEAFIDNHARLPQVNHLDGDPGNNHLSNLEWVTNAENLTHARRVLNKGVRPVYGIHKEDGSRVAFPSLQHAVEAGFTRANIQKCIAGVRTQHKGYQWFDAAVDYAMQEVNHE